MEHVNDAMKMLDLMVQPGLCVKDHQIMKVNQAAQALLLTPGSDITPLLLTGSEEYREFQDGCLYLTLNISGQSFGASVTRMGDFDVFILEQDADQTELQAMALAAQELRGPLTNVMISADRLFPVVALDDDPQLQEQVARLNRGLFQMLRVISNMSDAGCCGSGHSSPLETRDVGKFLSEVFNKAAGLVAHAGLHLTYRNLNEPVCSLIDCQMLERSVLNIISNAIKFTPPGGCIEASLTRRGNKLVLTVQDSGQGVAENLRSSVFRRYLRQPALEDSRFGIGLGMVLIRSAAARHGGTVLMDQPGESGTRITMTLAIRRNPDSMVRSPIFRVDYAGERDHALMELSEHLPFSLYETKKIN